MKDGCRLCKDVTKNIETFERRMSHIHAVSALTAAGLRLDQ